MSKIGNDILFAHLIEQHHPEIFRSHVFNKLINYHKDEDFLEQMEQLVPEESRRYKLRCIINSLSAAVPREGTLKEKEKILEQQVKESS